MRDASIPLPVRPLDIGDEVSVYGQPCVVSAVAWSHAIEGHVVTVEFSSRIRLRVSAAVVERRAV